MRFHFISIIFAIDKTNNNDKSIMKKSFIVALISAVALCSSVVGAAKDVKKKNDCGKQCKTEKVMPSNQVVFVENLGRDNTRQIVHLYSDCKALNGKMPQAMKCGELQRKGKAATSCPTCKKRFEKLKKTQLKGNDACDNAKGECKQAKCSEKQAKTCSGCNKH